MKQLIRITEEDLHNLVKEAVNKLLGEGAFDKYPKDLMDIELDRNLNVDNMNFSTAYSQLDDPMVRKVKGSTMRSMMSDTTGNDITENKLNRIIETTIGDVLSDTIPDTEGNVYTDSDEFKDWFYPEIKKVLTDREYNVLMSILNHKSLDTLNRLANEYGVTTERVRQLYYSALKKLGNSPELKKSIMSLLNGDYDKNMISRVNNMTHSRNFEPGSTDKEMNMDFIKVCVEIYNRSVGNVTLGWTKRKPLDARLDSEKFEEFVSSKNVEKTENGIANFFMTYFKKIYKKSKYSNEVYDYFHYYFDPIIHNVYTAKFYNKWHEIIRRRV